jgi:hypothetical protein
MTHPLLQTVAGSSDTVSAMLLLSTGNGTIKVGDHLPPQTANGIQSQTAADATIARPLGTTPTRCRLITITRTNRLHTNGGAVRLRGTHPGLTLTGTLAAEAGDGDGHRLVSVAWLL